MEKILATRKQTLHLEYPSAGSILKNPPGDHAGHLIEAVGLKGQQFGGAQISEKHANIIINRSAASCRDVEQLIKLAQKLVRKQFSINLELELDC